MDKLLWPESLDAAPSSGEAAKVWLHWKRTFQNFLAVLPPDGLERLGILTNYLSPKVYQYAEDCRDYPAAMRPYKNEIYARHILATRRQQPAETLDEYLQSLKTLSKDCNYQGVTSILYCEESIRDVFITGLTSGFIRQRLLENRTLDLKSMFDQARSLESAVRSSEFYSAPLPPINAAIPPADVPPELSTDPATLAASGLQGQKCFFCGNSRHSHSKCPARDVTCSSCRKKGHFQRVCHGRDPTLSPKKTSAATWNSTIAMVSAAVAPQSLTKSTTVVSINGFNAKALVDSGSSENFIHPKLGEPASLLVYLTTSTISMVTSSSETKVSGFCLVDLRVGGWAISYVTYTCQSFQNHVLTWY